MNQSKKLTFYGNTKDNTHCYQAVVRMVLKHYFPSEEYSFHDLDRLTGKKRGLWTWPMSGWVYLADKGLDVKYVGTFDYKRFVNEGKEYLREIYGDEVSEEQVKNSDIDYERDVAKKLLGLFSQEINVPKYEDIRKYLKDGYMIIVNVNYYSLYGKDGYAGHFVLVLSADADKVIIHDPGLPHKPYESVGLEKFMNAWNYSGVENRGLTLVRSLS